MNDDKQQIADINTRKMLQRQHYEQIKDLPATADLLAWLDEQERTNRTVADGEEDNLLRRSLYLQNAIVYAKVALYLREKISDM